MSRAGRVFVGSEPARGPHPGYRGNIGVNEIGVHIDTECEYLFIADEPVEWPDSEWVPCETVALIPWHRIDLIEWTDRKSEAA